MSDFLKNFSLCETIYDWNRGRVWEDGNCEGRFSFCTKPTKVLALTDQKGEVGTYQCVDRGPYPSSHRELFRRPSSRHR